VTVGFLVGVLVIVCGSILGIAYGFGGIDWVLNWIATPTPTRIASVAVEPVKPIATLTSPTPQPDVEVTVTPQEPTQVVNTPTATPTKTLMPTITNTPGSVVFFEEDFTRGLDNWEQWRETGMPDPRIIMDDFLQLNGLDYDKVGITSKILVPLVPGMMFEFEAEVDDLEDRFLYFDWYPGPTKRPVNRLGTLYLGINNVEVLLYYSQDPNNMRCNLDLDGTVLRRYQIEFGPNWEVNLFVDDELQAECSGIFKPPEILEGHVTFSAWGRVDSFKITMP
jgi:hypothetical protein